MLHQVADSPFITVYSMLARPRLTYFSLPMIIVLGVFDDSVTDSLSTFFRDAVTDHRFAILGVIVRDESDEMLQSR